MVQTSLAGCLTNQEGRFAVYRNALVIKSKMGFGSGHSSQFKLQTVVCMWTP